MTLPMVSSNTKGFYSNWLMMIPLKYAPGSKVHPFVQLELMRWGKFHYRNEIAITWALRDGVLIYRDIGMFVNDGPHRLNISVKKATITFLVDGAAICHAPFATFFDSDDRSLYFQVGTETSAPGERVDGEVYDLAVKGDNDTSAHLFSVTCVYRGYGVSWEPIGSGRFGAQGVFDPTKPYLKFEGVADGSKCTIPDWSSLQRSS
jgi:hypothetical protein